METTISVRPAGRGDIPAIAGALSRAFMDDPLWSWLAPDEGRRARLLERYFDLMLRKLFMKLPTRHAFTTANRAGAAMWAEPDGWRIRPLDILPLVPGTLRIFGRRTLKRLVVCLGAMEHHHPTEPHWYLEGLGTDPPHQRRGVGAALMAPILERCDRERLPAYLETQKERNVPYYRHHGFEVRDEMDLPGGGPHLWLMWREPR